MNQIASEPWMAETQAVDAPKRWLFVGGCGYLLGQAYLIPLVAAGPSWTLWPRIADLATVMIAIGVLVELLRGASVPTAHRKIAVWLAVSLWVAIFSVLLFTMMLPRLSSHFPAYEDALQWGAYQIIRMTQFLIVFFGLALVPLNEWRKKCLQWGAAAVLVVVSASVIANYVGLLPNETIVAHLPGDRDYAGPWAEFGEDGEGLGTVGYNHAYSACQIMLSLVFYFSLTDRRLTWTNGLLLLLATTAVFMSGSRAGFGAMLVLAVICVGQWIGRGYLATITWSAAGLVALAAVLTAMPGFVLGPQLREVTRSHNDLLVRQGTTFEGYESENLSGRTGIWKSRIKYLNEHPYRWIFGAGFGSAAVSGKNAHMLPLNVIVETGIIGLVIAGIVAWLILTTLWSLEPPGKPFFWGTIAIGLTCMTQETFYPVPALGHFLGFYLACLAIVLRLVVDRVAGTGGAASQQSALS